MTAGSVFLGIALLIAVVTYLTYPFWGGQEQERRSSRRSRRDLLTEQKEAILAQIRALDFDFETGKLPAEAHEAQRAQLLAEATAVLQELDALTGASGPPRDGALEAAIARARGTQPASKETLDKSIEAAIARARKEEPVSTSSTPSAAAVPAGTPASTNGHRTRFCPQCGSSVQAHDKFCTSCGYNLTAKATK